MKLFNEKIEKSCSYCLKKDKCKKVGKPCHSFSYDPLERIPKKNAKLQEFSKEDFRL